MNGSRAVILGYLAGAITAAPFNPQRDEPFVDELLDDFHDVDILEDLGGAGAAGAGERAILDLRAALH